MHSRDGHQCTSLVVSAPLSIVGNQYGIYAGFMGKYTAVPGKLVNGRMSFKQETYMCSDTPEDPAARRLTCTTNPFHSPPRVLYYDGYESSWILGQSVGR